MYDVFRHRSCVSDYWNVLPQDSDSYFQGHPLPCLDNLPSRYHTKEGWRGGALRSKWRAEQWISMSPCWCVDAALGQYLLLHAFPTLYHRGSHLLGMVSVAETVCLVCTFSLVASLCPTFCSTDGVMASLECLLILVFSFSSFFFPNLFPSQASLFSPG